MNTSKTYFAELKRQTRHITLRKNSSQFLVDPFFRQRILSLVIDPSLQISCDFGVLGETGEHYEANRLCNLDRIFIANCKAQSFSLITNVEEVELFTFHNLSDFNGFAQVKRLLFISRCNLMNDPEECPVYDLSCLSPTLEFLGLFGVKRISNYQLLTNLLYVEFYACDSIRDVSCFRHAEMVSFRSCPNVINVNSLAGVKELVLKNCHAVTDVSDLGRVKKIEISNCVNLNGLSALSTVHTLRVSLFPDDFLSPLSQNSVLNISHFDWNLSSIEFLTGNKLLRVLDISSNNNIRDISMLNSVVVLNIGDCSLVKSLIGLTALRELEMIGVEEIEMGFEVFQQLTKLTIGKVNNWIQTVQALEKAPFLFTLTLVSFK
jgi:hypothetical protein